MNEAYTKLMLHQNLSKEADAAFYEKLESTETRKRKQPLWKAAAVAACVLLLIPVTVLAVNYVFHNAKVEDLQYRSAFPGVREFKDMESVPMVGFEVTFDDIEPLSIEELPKDVRHIDDTTVSYDTWETAVEHLDIGLLKNPVLSDSGTDLQRLPYSKIHDGPMSHCEITYVVLEEQPCYGRLSANYSRHSINFDIEASFTVENPSPYAEDAYVLAHKYGESTPYRYRPTYTHEDYTTGNSIPVSITKSTLRGAFGGFPDYIAVFAVNNISYCIRVETPASGYDYNRDFDEDARALLLEILEGFTLE